MLVPSSYKQCPYIHKQCCLYGKPCHPCLTSASELSSGFGESLCNPLFCLSNDHEMSTRFGRILPLLHPISLRAKYLEQVVRSLPLHFHLLLVVQCPLIHFSITNAFLSYFFLISHEFHVARLNTILLVSVPLS